MTPPEQVLAWMQIAQDRSRPELERQAPQQLPVGVLTALIGVPVFLFLLSRATAGRH